ncbi:S-layer homology domain-containing protein [Candidatus Peregrinibacteria bacterium]|nr:S-layer homology domain-containing protein [Candidatus Peregrinibacteria bacterium]
MKNQKQIVNRDRFRQVKHWASILGVLALSVFTSNLNANFLMTSVIIQESPAFDGTVYPIQEIPDWSHSTSTERNMNYHDFAADKLIEAPEYRNDYLIYPSTDLVWGSKSDDVIRNTKITYSVAYAGTYKLGDLGENSGSHPAVDIKALAGTPVHAVANAIVYKVGNDQGGFGNYVVLQHNNVPNPDNPDEKAILFSSYSHLSKVFVTQGSTLYKNDVLGEVGSTGASTTNHLHFQLDSGTAPWHPYWPFTNADAKAAGVNFWDAVSAGVGKDNVYRYTYSPFKWVNTNLNGEIGNKPEIVEVQSSSETVTLSDSENTASNETSVVKLGFDNIKVENPSYVMVGNNQNLSVNLFDSNGTQITDADFDTVINVSVNDSSLAQVSPSSLSKSDFVGGTAPIKLYAQRDGSVNLNFEAAGRTYSSDYISLISEVKPFARFGILHDGMIQPRIPEKIQIQALDADGNPTPDFDGPGTIKLSAIQGKGTFSKSEITGEDFRYGVAEVQFTGTDDSDVVIQSMYGMAKATSKIMRAKLFSDLSYSNQFYDAVSYLFKKGTVQGYPDGTFQDSKTVSRVEALKFIYSGFAKTLMNNLVVTYSDTYNGQWYSDYVATASGEGIIQGYPDGTLKPEQGVNRVEFLKMLTKALGISVDPVVTEDPYDDVDKLAWFAPYVQFSKQKNIFPVTGSAFDPSRPMDRGEVAEVIYRMITVQQSSAEKYSVLLKPVN